MREGRTIKCPLRPSKSVEKEERGFIDHLSEDYVSIVQWKDNKVVYLGSNFSNIEPTKMVKRYCQVKRKRSVVFNHSAFTNTIKAWEASICLISL